MPSFDVVSEADLHEVSNALDQTVRELTQRFDFRGTEAEIEQHESGFKLTANSEDRVRAIFVVLQDKFVKRKLSLKFLEEKDPQPAGGKLWTMQVALKKGVDKDNARKIVSLIKERKMKVTPSIQGDAVRVTGKKRDDLQEAIAALRAEDLPLALSFDNFRD